MNDATFRRKAHAVLRACGNSGEFGHCIGCGKFVTEGIAHSPNCPVEELLVAGPTETSDGLTAALAEWRGKGPFRPYDVARSIGASTSAVPAVLRRLEAQGHTERGVWEIPA